jgi:hypothetical protein
MKKISKQYRQGDVLLDPCQIPATAKTLTVKDRVILAEGEATGHHHSIALKRNKLDVLLDGDQMYLRVKSPAVLEHQEHAAIVVEPGEYIVRKQMEVWLDEVRRVAD